MPRTHSSLIVAVALVVGALCGSVVAAGVAVAVDRDSAKKAKSVKVCVTPRKAVRSATATGACPAGTKKQKINVAGQRGPAGPAGPTGPSGPGATSLYYTQPPDDVLRPLGAGLSLDCQADADVRVRVTTDPANEVRGIVARDPGGVDGVAVLPDGFLAAQAESYQHGEVFGTNPATGRVEHLSFAVTWKAGLNACEVRGVLTPTQ
jgi:hypothetical protein